MPSIGKLQMDAAARLFEHKNKKMQEGDKPQKFSDTLQGMVQEVNDRQLASGKAIADFVAGQNVNLHEAMALGEEAQISFQFLLEIRNKLVEAYQEVSRMPV